MSITLPYYSISFSGVSQPKEQRFVHPLQAVPSDDTVHFSANQQPNVPVRFSGLFKAKQEAAIEHQVRIAAQTEDYQAMNQLWLYDEDMRKLAKKALLEGNNKLFNEFKMVMDMNSGLMLYADLDLAGIDLSNRILEDLNLQGTKLQGADLRGTRLWGAGFRLADMRKVDLRGANFSFGPFLTEADLRGADLRDTRIRDGANLEGADLRGTKLEGTIFEPEVKLKGAIFSPGVVPQGGADLRGIVFASEEEVLTTPWKVTPENVPTIMAGRYTLEHYFNQKIIESIATYKRTGQQIAFPLETEYLLILPFLDKKTANNASEALTGHYWWLQGDKRSPLTANTVATWQRIASLALSFKRWKYDAQGKQQSLLAQSGFQLIPVDKSDPNYKYGPIQFVKRKDEFKFTLTRGYLLVSHPSYGQLKIRNSSQTFGRDLMERTAYYTTPNRRSTNHILDPAVGGKPEYVENLKNLTDALEDMFLDYGRFKLDFDSPVKNGNLTAFQKPGYQALTRFVNDWIIRNKDKVNQSLSLALYYPDRPLFSPIPFEDENGYLKLTPQVAEEMRACAEATWNPRRFPNSQWMKLVQKGIDTGAELIIVDNSEYSS